MNYSLILKLSAFGLLIGVGSVYFISSSVEPICWLIAFVISAYSIARQAEGRFFLHGFLTSLANCVWVTGAHVLLFKDYVAHHAEEMAMMANSPLPEHPRLMMLITGPLIGAVSGLVQGLFVLAAVKLLKR